MFYRNFEFFLDTETKKSESQKHYKFLAFGLEFAKFSTLFSWPQYPRKIQNYNRTNFSHRKSEQLWQQNTINFTSIFDQWSKSFEGAT
jgi:hypothetical protein